MATVSFLKRSEKKKDAEITIWLRFRDGRKADVRVSTQQQIPAMHWNDKKGYLKDYVGDDKELAKRLKLADKHLEGIKTSLLTYYSMFREISPDSARKCVDAYLDAQKESVTKVDIPDTMNEYIVYKIACMKDGSLKVQGKTYEPDTIKAWNSFAKLWKAFQHHIGKKNITMDAIDMKIYSKFVDYMDTAEIERSIIDKETGEKKKQIGYRASSKRKYITTLKAVLNYAKEDGVSKNEIQTNSNFSKKERQSGGKKPYLNQTELDAIFALELEPDSMLSKVRDIFLIGCYCGQRISDYSNIHENNIDTLSDGTKVFRIKQKKTDTDVIVPFLSDNIDIILTRWNNKLPKVSDVLVNRHIKTICRMAGITQPFLVKEVVGNEIVEHWGKKCELITSHCARRSCVTGLYMQDILDIVELMSISGHKTEKAFYTYLCLSDEEKAQRIANKMKNRKTA